MQTLHALIFADGSMSVYAPGYPMDDIEDDRRDADRNEGQPDQMTKIALVRFEIVEVLFSPQTPDPAPQSELDRLKAENADLRRRLESPKAA